MLGLDLTDDEMRRVMECREKWSDDEEIERAAGICVTAMVEAFRSSAARRAEMDRRRNALCHRNRRKRNAANRQA